MSQLETGSFLLNDEEVCVSRNAWVRWGLIAWGWVGCGPEGDKEPRAEGSDPAEEAPPSVPTGPDPCDNPVVAATPPDGSVSAPTDGAIQVELAEADPTAQLIVAEDGGELLVGQTVVEGAVLTWTGPALSPATAYTATVEGRCTAETLHWTTTEIGAPLTVDPIDLTWALDIAQGAWVTPPGGVLEALLADYRLMLGVAAVDAPDAIDFVITFGYDARQSFCSPTVDLLGAAWTDPHFAVDQPYTLLATETFDLEIHDVTLAGTIAPDGSRIEDTSMSGTADTRGLGIEFGLGDDPGALCELLATFGATCVACDDGVETCLELEVHDFDAAEVPLTIEPLTAADVDENPSCALP